MICSPGMLHIYCNAWNKIHTMAISLVLQNTSKRYTDSRDKH